MKAGGTTSFYCCALADELHDRPAGTVRGRYGFSVRDFGEVQDAPVFRTRVDLGRGLCGVQQPGELLGCMTSVLS